MKRNSLLILTSLLSALATGSIAAAAGDAAAGKDKAITCATCHGLDGKREIPLLQGGVAKLAGMDEHKLLDALIAYRYGRRIHPLMQFFVLPYSDKDMGDIAAYFSAIKDPLFTPQK